MKKVNNSSQSKIGIIFISNLGVLEENDELSLEEKESICIEEAHKQGYKIVKVLKEKDRSSEHIAHRPILQELLNYCQKNMVRKVFTYYLGYISTQPAKYRVIRKKLERKGVTIFSPTELTGKTLEERLVNVMLASFTQIDRDIKTKQIA